MTFDTSLFDRAFRIRKEKRSRERRECLDTVSETLNRVRSQYDIREAYVTGSLIVEYRWNEDSDADVAVGGCSGSVLDVMKSLEDATGRVVDVIDLDTHPYPDTVRDSGLTVYG